MIEVAFKTRAERDEIERRSKLVDRHPTEFNELAAYETIDYAYSKDINKHYLRITTSQSAIPTPSWRMQHARPLDKSIDSELAYLNLCGVANLWQMCFLKVKGDLLPTPQPDFKFDDQGCNLFVSYRSRTIADQQFADRITKGGHRLAKLIDKMTDPEKGHQVTLDCIEADGTFVKAPKSKRKGDQDETEDNKKGQGIDWPTDPDLLVVQAYLPGGNGYLLQSSYLSTSSSATTRVLCRFLCHKEADEAHQHAMTGCPCSVRTP
ncbi:hypothetical protein KC343_g2328 [Hortaea werneckii]|nr:hypothetical protein KC323_g7351 [Hortaea werneckii]KAI6860171.1 hypothetical protein KC338_g7075 [Hortaea werneckii]KAI7269742.1 hypothetical protein KC352_g8401 [Hortaea werneckii]KAI7347436.1 hypothetical protein KC320_g7246 [Hortaea werneckii]KAI7570416.1 hypothetical protein KC317_g2479 [Hortaea werneckii]